MFQVDINQVTLPRQRYLAKFDQVILGKLQGGAFTPKAYTEAEAKKVDSASGLDSMMRIFSRFVAPPGPCRLPKVSLIPMAS